MKTRHGAVGLELGGRNGVWGRTGETSPTGVGWLLDAGEAERKTELGPGASALGDRLLCTKYTFCFPANSPPDARATISHLVGFLVTVILEAPPVTLTTCL